MTFKEAGILVLKQAQRDLTAEEITERALSQGFVRSTGKTPERTMVAMLYTTAASSDNPGVRRVFVAGRMRAKRGTVRWRWVPGAS